MKLSTKAREYLIAMLVIPMIAAFVGYVLVSPGPVVSSSPRTTTISSPRGATVPQKGAPTVSQQTSEPGAATKAPAANPRGAVRSEKMQAHELFRLLDKEPASIASIAFLNGSDSVTVLKTNDQTRYIVTLPEKGGREEALKLVREKGVFWTADDDSTSSLRNFAFSFGPIIVFALLFMFFMRGGIGGARGKMGNFGKSRTTSSDQEGALRVVTFDDVAGAEEAVKELRRIAKGLRWRRLYSWFGAKLPKGVLLVGPPGTGKTLLARAVAGETNGTFDATSGSDFIEMLVGVGASRVRDMFETGRAKVKETGKPHIIFIDEIDAVGGRRGGGAHGGKNEEREQTLNALLVEMDGMKNNEGLFIIAATNRVDMLDEALMRPGRFDSVVDVDLPNKEGRTAIFKIHTRKKPLAEDVNCVRLAERTWGYSGAEIEGACNRAALIAAERYGLQLPETPDDKPLEDKVIEDFLKEAKAVITMEDFQEGIDFIRMGATNESRQNGMTDEDKENTTVHEAGHAIVTDVMPGMDPIVKVTNVNRSKALGYVQTMPSEDRYSMNVKKLVGRIVMAMAGRVAQEVVLGVADTGASNDFEQACGCAYNMVTKWGMSRVGHISVGGGGAAIRGIGGSGGVQNYGPKLADEIDDEWRRIVEACYDLATYIVTTDRERLDALVKKLKEVETLDTDGWAEFSKAHPSKVDKEKLVIDLKKPSKKGA